MAKQGILIDVRERAELEAGMAAQALWIASADVVNETDTYKAFISKLGKDERLLFYCARGFRAAKVADRLALKGFSTGVLGGYKDWVKAGLPVQAPPQIPSPADPAKI